MQRPITFNVPASDSQAFVGIGAADTRRILNVPYLNQPVTNWCWATCATMLSRFLKSTDLKICEAVSKLIPTDSCCVGAPQEGSFDQRWTKGSCNRTCSVSEVGLLHTQLGLSSTHTRGNVSFEELRNEIVIAGRPVEVAYAWTGGGGHVALVQGVDADTQNLNIHDPWPDNGQMVIPYSSLVTAYGKGSWFHTWTNIAAT